MSKKVALFVFGLNNYTVGKTKQATKIHDSINEILESKKIDAVVFCNSVFDKKNIVSFSDKYPKEKIIDLSMFNNEIFSKNSIISIPSYDGDTVFKSSEYLKFILNPNEYTVNVAGFDATEALPFYAREIKYNGYNTFIIPDCSSFHKQSSDLCHRFKIKTINSQKMH